MSEKLTYLENEKIFVNVRKSCNFVICTLKRRRGRAVRQRSAKPFTAVQIRSSPHFFRIFVHFLALWQQQQI